ncbi:MAG: type II toxin-antitoxin system ParD family antitoxin [Pseudomonadota bacterium]
MEKTSITMTDAHYALANEAIEAGEYASMSELIRDALRQWEHKRELRTLEYESLKAFIQEGIDDLNAGRTVPFDIEDIKRRGRERLATQGK